MGLFDTVLDFIEGVKSVIDVSGVIQGSVSDAISNGIERGFRRIRKPLEQSVMRISFALASVFLIAWGAAMFLDSFVPYRGMGFVIVGMLIGLIALVFFQEKGTGN